MTQIRAELFLVLGTALWAGTFVLVKASLQSISPSGFVLLRFSIAAGIALVLWGKSLKQLDKRMALHGLVIGVLFGLGFVLQSIGLADTTPTTSAFITGTTVVFVPFVYLLFERRRVSTLHWLSTAAVLIGLYLFMAPERSGIHWADVLTLASAVGWACYIVAIDVFTTSSHTSQEKRDLLVILQFVVTAGVAAVGIGVMDGGALEITWNTELVVALLYCAIAATVATTWIQTNIQRYTHPVRAGVIYSLEPLFASVIAFTFFDERWEIRQGFGAAILLASVIVPDLLAMQKARNDQGRNQKRDA